MRDEQVNVDEGEYRVSGGALIAVRGYRAEYDYHRSCNTQEKSLHAYEQYTGLFSLLRAYCYTILDIEEISNIEQHNNLSQDVQGKSDQAESWP